MTNLLKKIAIYICCILSAAFFLTASSNAGNPNPGMGDGERIIGPATEGVLYMEFVEDFDICNANYSYNPCYVGTVVGACQKQSIVLRFAEGITLEEFVNIPEENILNFRLGNAAPAGCYSETGGEELIITGVSKFNNSFANIGGLTIYAIGARVNISVVEPK